MGQRGGEGRTTYDRAHEPLEHVDVVDGLVHQGPAAVEGLRALPAALVVVGLVPPPGAIGHAEGEPAEPALVDGILEEPARSSVNRR